MIEAQSVRSNVVLALALAVSSAMIGVGAANAAWDPWGSSWLVVNSFPLSGGSSLDGRVAHRFNTGTGNEIQIWGNNVASQQIDELYVYAAGQERCGVNDPWYTWATADNIAYNSNTVATDGSIGGAGIGYFQINCTGHAYKSYLEVWGVDPPPNWQWTSGYVIT